MVVPDLVLGVEGRHTTTHSGFLCHRLIFLFLTIRQWATSQH